MAGATELVQKNNGLGLRDPFRGSGVQKMIESQAEQPRTADSHGIPAGVCGEESSLLYGPVATLGLRVVIHEDDFDDAVEVLTARPESLPEESVDAPADAPVRWWRRSASLLLRRRVFARPGGPCWATRMQRHF